MIDASYGIGGGALIVAATLAVLLFQMRRTVVVVAARRIGAMVGGLAGLGLALIGFRALDDRLANSARWVELLAVATLVVTAIALARIAAQQAALFAQRRSPNFPTPGPAMRLEPAQRVVWSASLSSKWLALVAVAVIFMGPLSMLAPDAPLWLLGVLVLAGVACMSLASIHVTADARGLTVKYGVLPWPATNIAVDRIASASVIDVRPTEWGGWGYRGTLTLMRQAAVVLRAGPGIRVDLVDGRVFVVTVDNPETGVALINAEVARVPD